ncbi:NADPH-dependent ferric siderophore reductase [Brachybacterium sp. P6-10-X1]|uniref:siderophore-interacting protein n=1 Tax=Brachybacterium sp. P6-10-X1 TaxID=1903186 RepID=UPI000971A66C|nr:siderophore-interacting protein [Brachybacterium sp. P6-10-X1]APX32104.1 NADPH-dependent ferric siderophore reductase [Brachybacterium sp. P6-10-X1]
METTTAQSTPPVPPSPRGPKKPRKQAVLEVLGKTRLSPRLLRVRIGGEQYSHLRRSTQADAYVKLLIADPASGLQPPYDLDALREDTPELLPARRTYTVRHWDDEAQSLDLDVVLHGHGDDSGTAARWADEAQPGDRIALMGAGGGYTPEGSASSHLLIGDHAALPAIAASLESMDPEATGLVLLHLDEEEDLLELTRPAGVELRWVIGPRERLLEAVTALDLSAGTGLQVFCHAERALTKQLRRVLVADAGIPRDQISISAYWALGRIEDQFQAEKREAIGKIDE